MKHYRERLASSETSEYSIFPISAVRDEPFIPPTPGDTRATPTSASVEQPPVRVLRCLIREIPGFPGVLEDGRWTVRHPLVQTYLKNLGNVYDDAAGFTGASTSRGEPARDVRGCIEVGRVEDVGQVVGRHLSDVISEAVFILAALEVVDIIRHPAHFAFWGANVRERTSLIIQQSQVSRYIVSAKSWDRFSQEAQRILQFAIYPEVKAKPSQKRLTRAQKKKAQAKVAQAAVKVTHPTERAQRKGKGKEKGPNGAGTTLRRSLRRAAPVAQSQVRGDGSPQAIANTAATALEQDGDEANELARPRIGEHDTAQSAITMHDRKRSQTAQTTRDRSFRPLADDPPAVDLPSPVLALLQLSVPRHAADVRTIRGDSNVTAAVDTGDTAAQTGRKRKASEAIEDAMGKEERPENKRPRRNLRTVREPTAKGKAFAADQKVAREKAEAIQVKRAKRS